MEPIHSSRRNFLKTSMAASAATFYPSHLFSRPSGELDFPIIDYHVHLAGNFNIDVAVKLAEERNIQFGIVEHPGPGYAIKNDKELEKYIELLSNYPVYKGIQPVFPGWSKNFSKELLSRLDYVLMDALTIPEGIERWGRIWRIDYYVEDKHKFMDNYMKFNEQILTTENIDIFAWPTFLPTAIARDYDELWTDDRMQTIIDMAKAKNIAIEINEISHVPNDRFVKMAKKEGLKFTFGTDARNHNAGRFNYCFEMAKYCGITKDDMFYLKD